MRDFWQGRKVFVTGVTGVVSSWLVEDLLDKRASIIGLVWNGGAEPDAHWNGDLRDVLIERGTLEDFHCLEGVIRQHHVDTVFHLGGQAIVGTAHRSPHSTFEANIRGTYNLLEACRLHRERVQRVVIASSDKAYGEPTLLPITEDMPLDGRHPYDVSKSCADLLAQAYHRTYDLPVAIARCGNIYGGGDLNWSRIVPRTIRALLCGERPLIGGDGSHVRDYIYVKDERYIGCGNYVPTSCASSDLTRQAILISNDDGALLHQFDGIGGDGPYDFSPDGQLAYCPAVTGGAPLEMHAVNIDGTNDHMVFRAPHSEIQHVQNLHLSWPDKVTGWFIASLFPSTDNVPATYAPLLDEIIEINTDGSHTFLARTYTAYSPDLFWPQPLAIPSADGSRISFNSIRSGTIDQFILSTRNPAGPPDLVITAVSSPPRDRRARQQFLGQHHCAPSGQYQGDDNHDALLPLG